MYMSANDDSNERNTMCYDIDNAIRRNCVDIEGTDSEELATVMKFLNPENAPPHVGLSHVYKRKTMTAINKTETTAILMKPSAAAA